MNPDIYIIGQGLAGSILSMRLEALGLKFKVIDTPGFSQSSRIAAGLANPVVLKRQKWVADAEDYLPSALSFYSHWQKRFSSPFLHSVKLEHIFHQAGESNDWEANSLKPHLAEHLGPIVTDKLNAINSPHGRAKLKGVFWLDTVAFLKERRQQLQEGNQLIESNFEEIALPDSAVTIFCNGHLLRLSHPKIAAAFTPTKGEVMIIKAPNLPEDRMLHAGVFTLPLGDQFFKVGATYAHHDLTENTSQKGLKYLQEKLEAFYSGPYEVVEQKAGVRPNIKDRKPLMGRIAANEYAFNGMGSRGVLMAPYLSEHFLNYLLKGDPLNPNWDLNRFISI